MFSNRRNQNLKNLSAHLGTADWIWKIYRQLTQESWVIPLILSWHPWSYMERARGKCLNDLKRLFLDTTIWKFFCSKIPWHAYKSNVRVKWSLLDQALGVGGGVNFLNGQLGNSWGRKKKKIEMVFEALSIWSHVQTTAGFQSSNTAR